MKKLTAETAFDFVLDSRTTLHISSEGCLVTDEQARIVVRRFPFVTSEEASVKEEVARETETPKKRTKKGEDK